MTDELMQELKTYEDHHEELLGSARGQYVLIRGEKVYGTYESKADAIAAGYKEFGNEPFLVKQVLEVDVPLNFVSSNIAL